jgi:hypothetical protein
LPVVLRHVDHLGHLQCRARDRDGDAGQYRFVDIPIGIYKIQYQLAGFQGVIHEDVRLNAGFVARIDVVMKVGALNESITVTGQSPVVDVSTTAGITNFTKEMLQTVPNTRSMWQVLAMSPGVRPAGTPDVGGSQLGIQQGYKNYGTSGQVTPQLEGINTRQAESTAGFFYDYAALEEAQVKSVGNDAGLARTRGGFMSRLRGFLGSGGPDEASWDDVEETLQRRALMQAVTRRVRNCRAVVVTLGLAEVWRDIQTDTYLNCTPIPSLFKTEPNRYEFHLSTFAQNWTNLEAIYELLTRDGHPDFHVIVTVSPVPLMNTFSTMDIVVANAWAKSLLRAAAQEWAMAHPNVDYFPSYEIVQNSDGAAVWEKDLRHVTGSGVQHIMKLFVRHYIE